MHKIAATPGGWNPQAEGVIFIQQTPAPIVFISAADTDIQTLAAAASKMPAKIPQVRAVNLLQLQQQLTIDTYAEEVLERAEVIILRLLGGRSYWSYGLEILRETVQKTKASLIVMPGEDSPDPDLISHSNVSLSAVNKLWRYFTEGGVQNFVNALLFAADTCLKTAYHPPLPQTVSRVGIYDWTNIVGQVSWLPLQDSRQDACSTIQNEACSTIQNETCSTIQNEACSTIQNDACSTIQNKLPDNLLNLPTLAKVGILFYRAHYLSGNLAPIDALCQALVERNLVPVPVFVSSLREPDLQIELLEYFQPKESEPIQLLLNTTSFAVSGFSSQEPEQNSLKSLDVPVLQAIFSGGGLEQWETELQGLSPRDVAMNVALPEVDGKIITRAVSFKAVQTWNSELETDVVGYVAAGDRIQFVADLTANWVKMKQNPAAHRRLAIILANYPTRNARLANGVGLDTPASCVEILKAMQQAGYPTANIPARGTARHARLANRVGLDTPASCVEILKAMQQAGYQIENIPASGNELIELLTSGVTNDPEGRELRPVHQSLDLTEYEEYFASLPQQVQDGICKRWGLAEGHTQPRDTAMPSPYVQGKETAISCSYFPIPGIQFGNVFVGIQPSRGYEIDPSLNYHAPDLEPTHNYLAYYYWLREKLGIDAIIHAGKHGNLEWLPGKSIALSNKCYPEVALGAVPNFYPFIVNDPGEGSQAKRRSQAVIIDHLTPPMTRAELYGPLQQLEGLIDEYYEAQSLDPSRLPVICDRITQLILQENLHQDLGLATGEDGDAEIPGRQESRANFSPSPRLPLSASSSSQSLIPNIDGYLCELKEAQIRDGLHIFGQCPQGRQLRDLIVAIARHPGNDRIGLTRALAKDRELDFDPLTADPGERLNVEGSNLQSTNLQPATLHIIGDVIEELEQQAADLVEQLIQNPSRAFAITNEQPKIQNPLLGDATRRELEWICDRLLPSLQQTDQELIQLLRGLDGRYVPSGPSGAPTRGRPEVLPQIGRAVQ